MTIIFLTRTTHPTTSYYTFVLIMSLLAVSLGVAYAPWFASFTETIEKRNPALTATGLAVGGWITRVVVTISAMILPFVVSSMTPLVTYGTQVGTLAAAYAPELTTAGAIDPATLAALTANPGNAAAGARAVAEVSAHLHVNAAVAIQRLTALGTASKQAGFRFLQAHLAQVQTAAKATPAQWQHWWWVCVVGEIVFLPLIFLVVGRWSPRRARLDAEEHQRMIEEELKQLAGAG